MYGQAGVVLFSILAMVSGARSYRQIHTVIDRRLGLLNAAFPGAALRRGGARPPARVGVPRPAPRLHVGARHPPGARRGRTGTGVPTSRRGARSYRRSLTIALRCDRRVAIDGKTLRGSFDAFADRKAAHVLSAFAVDHRIILAHEVVAEKSNEIPAVQTLIETLGLTGRVFTIDALPCQKNIRDRQGDGQ